MKTEFDLSKCLSKEDREDELAYYAEEHIQQLKDELKREADKNDGYVDIDFINNKFGDAFK